MMAYFYAGLSGSLRCPCIVQSPEGEGGAWSQVVWPDYDVRIYQRPVYGYKQGLPGALFQQEGVNPAEDEMYLMYTGSRWLGTVYYGAKLANLSGDYWTDYVKEYHGKTNRFVSFPLKHMGYS